MKYTYLLLTSVIFIACQQKKKEPITDAIKKEVMAIHDEVMPATSQLMKLRNDLKEICKNDSTKVITLQPCIDSLKLAHDEMMKWMNNYNHSFSETDTTYYIQEKEKIKQVNYLYKTTISSAKQKLN